MMHATMLRHFVTVLSLLTRCRTTGEPAVGSGRTRVQLRFGLEYVILRLCLRNAATAAFSAPSPPSVAKPSADSAPSTPPVDPGATQRDVVPPQHRYIPARPMNPCFTKVPYGFAEFPQAKLTDW